MMVDGPQRRRERLSVIRARVEQFEDGVYIDVAWQHMLHLFRQAHSDARSLLDEVDRLRSRTRRLKQVAREVTDENTTLRRQRNVAARVTEETTWIWGDSDDDDIESLAEEATVTMTAGQLRQLLADPKRRERAPRPLEAKPCPDCGEPLLLMFSVEMGAPMGAPREEYEPCKSIECALDREARLVLERFGEFVAHEHRDGEWPPFGYYTNVLLAVGRLFRPDPKGKL